MRKNLLPQVLIGKKEVKYEKINYNKYIMTTKEMLLYATQGIFILIVFGYFFYRSVMITICLLPAVLLFLRNKKLELCKIRKNKLNIQFKEALNSINSSIQAGYSLENAFFESYKDMTLFYGQDSLIVKELLLIKIGIRNNRTLEEMILDLGRRSGIEDIKNFADVLVIGKQSGGNINEIIQTCIIVIDEKVSVLQEIETIICARKYEQKFMNAIPFLIIGYIELTAKGFFSVLYHNIFGQIIMTICLVLYLVSIYISSQITNIVI